MNSPRATPPSILEQIGIDPKHFDWQQLAACNGLPDIFSTLREKDSPAVDIFFEGYEKSNYVAMAVDQLCLSCPVVKECFELGVKTKSTGVFGGFYMVNGEVNRMKNSHKSLEIGKRLARKIHG